MRLQFARNLPFRSYSLASLPGSEVLKFHIRRLVDGSVTSALFDEVAVGDEVFVEGPYGRAYLRPTHRGPLVAVAGGSGLGVMRAVVEAALAAAPERLVQLYFGARREQDVYFEAECRALCARYPGLSLTLALSAPDAPTSRRVGTVGSILNQDAASLAGFKIYAAGPSSMVDEVRKVALAHQLERRDFHADGFGPEPDAPGVYSRKEDR
jgi:CDP-4-dehydro-6-deoxyglucose reductase/ferredoxin-NAD(P)+ reductase (naphthalene dioxygenase ferredoxin-specific)